MAFQLPTDLINQVQIAARNAAGLNGYNPDDPSLPCLPSFDASIFGLDPSAPDHLRCKNCKGKLLRGVDSVICIYCGKQQIDNELPPDPICFTNTFGYQWLLHSLDLDQSVSIDDPLCVCVCIVCVSVFVGVSFFCVFMMCFVVKDLIFLFI